MTGDSGQSGPVDEGGPAKKLDQVFAQFDDALRRAASKTLQHYRGAASLETSDVINDAWLRLAATDPERLAEYHSLERVAFRAVKHVVLDHLRRRRTRRSHLISLPMGPGGLQPADSKVYRRWDDVTEAIDAIAGYAPRVAEVLSLRLLGRQSFDQIADRLSVGRRTVEGDWSFGRALLRRRLSNA